MVISTIVIDIIQEVITIIDMVIGSVIITIIGIIMNSETTTDIANGTTNQSAQPVTEDMVDTNTRASSFVTLDDLISGRFCGWKKGELAVLWSAPGSGKSSFRMYDQELNDRVSQSGREALTQIINTIKQLDKDK